MTTLMNAAMLTAHGEPLRLQQVPVPELRPGHALVRIEASGVNPLDLKIRTGHAAHARVSPPAILGIDMAGSVESRCGGCHGICARRHGVRNDRWHCGCFQGHWPNTRWSTPDLSPADRRCGQHDRRPPCRSTRSRPGRAWWIVRAYTPDNGS